jgi:hypothetical protein
MYTVNRVSMYSKRPFVHYWFSIHYIGWGYQSPNTMKYNVLNGNFVLNLCNLDLRNVFQEHISGLYAWSVPFKRSNNFGSVLPNRLDRRLYKTKFSTHVLSKTKKHVSYGELVCTTECMML